MTSRRAVVLDSPVRLAARTQRDRSAWEAGIRYAAAYACTLIAVAASQLVVPNGVVVALALLTLAGLPVSLVLRRARRSGKLRLQGRPVSRPFINAGVMCATVLLCAAVLGPGMPTQIDRLLDISFATQTVRLLMQAFLIFGVCRCLAILNDKDAVLCTVPSFSVLLLLIVIHKGVEVVAFFALWAVASAVLIALDFRSDVRGLCSATVPGLVPEQELKLSGRALATVLGFSLSVAGVLSYNLNGSDSSSEEGWISHLASRLNGFSLDLPDTSSSGGPERQIDFSSLPSTPVRTKIWSIETRRTDTWQAVRPSYWRMFTLSSYDGQTWSQANGVGQAVPQVLANLRRWPLNPDSGFYRRRQFLSRQADQRDEQRGERRSRSFLDRPFIAIYDTEGGGPAQSRALYFGASQPARPSSTSAEAAERAAAQNKVARRQGRDARPVRLQQTVRALTSNTGFLPILPGAVGLRFDFQGSQPTVVRERPDASLDVGVMVRSTRATVQSEVVPIEVFGLNNASPPLTRVSNPKLKLAEDEERRFLNLPPDLPKRVRDWAKQRVRRAAPDESNYKRATRLSTALQEGAFYTLRPPLVPTDRDAADFFLFESRRGYCTHFAGSLAVTCRAVGIPARVVSGFTNAEWPDEFPGMAELRESGAHAWVEVWEPGWGWVLVDPTPPDSRGNNASSVLQSIEDFRGIIGELLAKKFAPLSLPALAGTVSLLALALAALRARRGRALQGERSASHEDALARREIERLFARASRRITRRFRPRAPWETPSEWLDAASATLDLRDESPLRELFGLVVLARFAPRPLDATHAQDARSAWQRLSWARNPRPKDAPRSEPAST